MNSVTRTKFLFRSLFYFHVVSATAEWMQLRENIQQWAAMIKATVADDCLVHIACLTYFSLRMTASEFRPANNYSIMCSLCWHLMLSLFLLLLLRNLLVFPRFFFSLCKSPGVTNVFFSSIN